MKNRHDPLDILSTHISGAVKSFLELLRSWRQHASAPAVVIAGVEKPARGKAKAAPAVPARRASRGARQSSGKFPWDQIMKIAQKLLGKDPARAWRIGELAQAVRAAGADVASATGMHFGLLPRLRESGLIKESARGTFTATKPTTTTAPKAAKPVARPAAAKVEKPAARKPGKASRKPVAAKKPAARVVEAKEEPSQAADSSLLAACEKILEADPFKVWSGVDLVKAVREAGLMLPSWKGLHFSLPSILKKAKLVESEGRGFRAAVRPASADAPKSK